MEEIYSKLRIINDNIEVLNFTIDALKAKEVDDASILIFSSVASQMSLATRLLENNIIKMMRSHEKEKE